MVVPLRAHKIALLGDLHGKWNSRDSSYFGASGHDLLLFVGDLGSGTLKNELSIIREISRLRVSGLVLPGNNDAEFLGPLSAELAHLSGAGELLQLAVGAPAAFVEPCGYSSHVLSTEAGLVTLIAGRPCAMGGSEFSFGAELERNYGVTSLEHSAGRLKRLVDEASSDWLVFLAHNGPFGRGGDEGDPWARDFPIYRDFEHEAPKDWGDSDLRSAIDHARAVDKTVLAVIAGHMHRRPEGRRPLTVRDEAGTIYVNPAVVPRIVESDACELHHFVEMRFVPGENSRAPAVEVEERWVELE